ncbi:Pentatricopeptide repeat-containing protein, chloroplastic [Vitis vinifera]|uniref:Pentatricopeptide repeat-containing protein, chloroplastic n=1 Tax=Vitis vinifera TaxID=29760 RepID=A0A438GXM9_VITVI|nr:Pentatricopeptide repeat-containing protein, chloroplastic [Vitis vinifera]
MRFSGFDPNQFTYGSVLSACTALGSPLYGELVYSLALKNGFFSNGYVRAGMIDLFAKLCSFEDALRVFQDVLCENVVCWNAVISGAVKNRENWVALDLFCQMCCRFFMPNSFTFSSILTACAALEELEFGRGVQGWVIKCGAGEDVFVGTAIIDLYANKDDSISAFHFFKEMRKVGEKINNYTITSVLTACTEPVMIKEAVQLHSWIFKTGFYLDSTRDESTKNLAMWAVMISAFAQSGSTGRAVELFQRMLQEGLRPDNSLFTMYSKCGSLEESYTVFEQMPDKDNVSWASMITGFSEHDHAEQAVQLFREMLLEEIRPDQMTLTAALTACSALHSLEKGKEVHGYALRARVGKRISFHAPPWFQDMLKMVSSVIGAVAFLNSLDIGTQLHACVTKMGLNAEVSVGSSLVTMYSKCGSIDECHKVFEQIEKPDLISWTAMIVSYAQHGKGAEALKVYDLMRKEGTKPDSVTFVGVLSACSHNGMVEEGYSHLNSMAKEYGIEPGYYHYACMVDLLGRSGRLKEAERFINNMPIEPDALLWGILLAACKVHGDIELGRLAAKESLSWSPVKLELMSPCQTSVQIWAGGKMS